MNYSPGKVALLTLVAIRKQGALVVVLHPFQKKQEMILASHQMTTASTHMVIQIQEEI